MNESSIIAKYVKETLYEDLPPRVVEMTKMSLLDALGVTLAASGQSSECRAFADLAIESGGTKESTILGFQDQVPALMAAFVNGSMAHALDFEDAHDKALVHPNAVSVPVALALAEKMGNVDGKKLITALAVGCDIVCRFGLAFKENPIESGWYIPPILGSFGAVAAACKLLNLNEEQILDAFSLNLCQTTCSAELTYSPYSDIRAIRDAFAAKGALFSGLLAKKGIKGFDHPIEGKAGLFSLYSKGNYDSSMLTEGLGTRYEGENVSFKPWPTCRGTHTFIEAALQLMSDYFMDTNDIVDMRVVVSSFNRMLCEPMEVKTAPKAVIDAKFSIPFTLATALYYKRVDLDHFTPQRLMNEDVLQLARKTRYDVDPDLGLRDATRGFLEIRTKDNKIFSKQVDHAYGNPENPIKEDDLINKFMDCAKKAVKKIPEKHLEKAVKYIMTLETVGDIREIMDSFR
ncbi:MmgE/PrpD family protein [Thermodesulfobacteriota bacterium]